MEGLIWYVLLIIEKRMGGVLLKFVELSYGILFLTFKNALKKYFLPQFLCVDMFSYF